MNVSNNLSKNLSTNFNLIETHPILIWFNNNYNRIEDDPNKQDVLTYLLLKDIFLNFNESDYYHILTPRTKSTTTFFYIKKLFNDNKLFKDDYIESIDRTINKMNIHKYHLLKGWELKNVNSTTDHNSFI